MYALGMELSLEETSHVEIPAKITGQAHDCWEAKQDD